MRGLSRDEFEQIAKIRRIKNYEYMKKEDLLIPLLKSKERKSKISFIKQSIKEIFQKKKKKDMMNNLENQ